MRVENKESKTLQEFEDKVAVITGAASGIGRALANHCVKEGMHIVLADIEKSRLTSTEKELKNQVTTVLAIPTDVSRATDIETLAQKSFDYFKHVDLL